MNGGLEADGVSYGRGVGYVRVTYWHHVLAHELAHQFQYDEYQSFNAWLQPLAPKFKWTAGRKILSEWVSLDLPYLSGAYFLEGYHGFDDYYKNFFEFEAESFVTNRYVRRHR